MVTKQIADQEIIERIILGEHGLFEILIRRNNPFLYKIGRSYNFSHEAIKQINNQLKDNNAFNASHFES